MSERNNYSLRSKCRSHGSCNCQNSPNLPSTRQTPRRRKNSKKQPIPTTQLPDHSELSDLLTSDLSELLTSDLSDSDFDTSTTSQTSVRYSSSASNCAYASKLSSTSVSILEDSDYSSNSSCDSLSLSALLSGEKRLKSILVNSEGGEKSRSKWFPRNVTFGFATSTPLSGIQNRKLALQDFEDLRDAESLEEYPGSETTISKMSSSSRTRGKVLNQNVSKFSSLEEGGRRGVSYSSLKQRTETSFENGDGRSQEEQISHSRGITATVFNSTSTSSRGSGRRAGTPSSVHSRDSNGGAGDGRVVRRRPRVPIIDEGAEDLFLTPGGRNGNYNFTGDQIEFEEEDVSIFKSYTYSGLRQIRDVFYFGVRILLSGPLFVWAQVMRYIGHPLYWVLVQCLVSEKWVLDREGNLRDGDVNSQNSQNWVRRWVSRICVSSTTAYNNRVKSLFRGGGGDGVHQRDEYYSDDEGSGEWEVVKGTNLNGDVTREGKKFDLNGHGYEQSITTSTTGQGHGGGMMSLYRNAKAKYFGTSVNNQRLQSTQFGGMENIVGVSRIGRIAGWGKNLLVCWKTNNVGVANNRGRFVSNTLSDDESDAEGDAEVLTMSSRALEGYALAGKVLRFLAKLALILLFLGMLGYLVYFLWPIVVWMFTEAWESSKGYASSAVDGVSSFFSEAVQLGTLFITSLMNFSILSKPPNTQTPVAVVLPTAEPPSAPQCISPVVPPVPEPVQIPLPPPPPAISKEEFDALRERINYLEAQIKLNEGKLYQVDGSQKKEISEVRATYENHRQEMDAMKTSISTEMTDEIEKQVKISCKTNCPDPIPIVEVPVTPPPAPTPTPPSTAHIQALIDQALQKYDADKTGRPDLALESSGGSILNTRCTKSSKLRHSVVSLWGWKIWSPPNNPRTIIQPGVVPGECWAFEGSVGDVVIQLVSPAVLTGFTMEHIPKLVSPYGNIDSAPYQFQVLGLTGANDLDTAHDYGTYSYEDNNQALQYFEVLNPSEVPYPVVELKILSNHGNLRYTCLYRFRVHGHLADWLRTPFTTTVQDHE